MKVFVVTVACLFLFAQDKVAPAWLAGFDERTRIAYVTEVELIDGKNWSGPSYVQGLFEALKLPDRKTFRGNLTFVHPDPKWGNPQRASREKLIDKWRGEGWTIQPVAMPAPRPITVTNAAASRK